MMIAISLKANLVYLLFPFQIRSICNQISRKKWSFQIHISMLLNTEIDLLVKTCIPPCGIDPELN
jgi:hypothetical protein